MPRGFTKEVKQKRKLLFQARKNQILKAAMTVFAQHGFQHTDVEKIAVLANVGKGTVYRHFKSKERLFLSVMEWGFNTLKEEISEAIQGIADTQKKIEAALFAHLVFFEKNRNFYRVLIEERTKSQWRMEKQWKNRFLAHLHLLEDVLEEGMKKGLFKKIDSTSAAYGLWGLTNALLYKWLMSEKEYPIKKELKTITKIYFQGILKKN